MGRMNWPRIWLGAAAAGVIINLTELVVHGVLLRPAWHRIQLGGMVRDPGLWAWGLRGAMGFAVGLALAWWYVAIRPRFGPGPKTAARVAGVSWFLAWGLPGVGLLLWGPYDRPIILAAMAAGALECLAGAMVAGKLYMEAPPE